MTLEIDRYMSIITSNYQNMIKYYLLRRETYIIQLPSIISYIYIHGMIDIDDDIGDNDDIDIYKYIHTCRYIFVASQPAVRHI